MLVNIDRFNNTVSVKIDTKIIMTGNIMPTNSVSLIQVILRDMDTILTQRLEGFCDELFVPIFENKKHSTRTLIFKNIDILEEFLNKFFKKI